MSVRDTSIAAHEEIKGSGTMSKQQRAVLDLVRKHPGKTRLELSQISGMRLSSVCGRVNELVRAKLIDDAEVRPCSLTGKSAHVLKLMA